MTSLRTSHLLDRQAVESSRTPALISPYSLPIAGCSAFFNFFVRGLDKNVAL
jgi:hypothetical protein